MLDPPLARGLTSLVGCPRPARRRGAVQGGEARERQPPGPTQPVLRHAQGQHRRAAGARPPAVLLQPGALRRAPAAGRHPCMGLQARKGWNCAACCLLSASGDAAHARCACQAGIGRSGLIMLQGVCSAAGLGSYSIVQALAPHALLRCSMSATGFSAASRNAPLSHRCQGCLAGAGMQARACTCMQAMKINAKLDGVNVGLAAPPFPWVARPFMVFGASLSHKGARARPGRPSCREVAGFPRRPSVWVAALNTPLQPDSNFCRCCSWFHVCAYCV